MDRYRYERFEPKSIRSTRGDFSRGRSALMGKVGSLGDQDAYSISISMISENLTTSSTLDSVGLQKSGQDIGNNR